jgi:hypothetical protein
MLWELSINEDLHSSKILPLFINEDMTLRPFAGEKIWDKLLEADAIMTVLIIFMLKKKCIMIYFKCLRNFLR